MALSRPALTYGMEHGSGRGFGADFRVKCAAASQCSMRAPIPNQSKRFKQSDLDKNSFSIGFDQRIRRVNVVRINVHINYGQCTCHR